MQSVELKISVWCFDLGQVLVPDLSEYTSTSLLQCSMYVIVISRL